MRHARRTDASVAKGPWFLEPEEKIAGSLYSWALATEYYSYRRRMRNARLYRLATNEDPPIGLGLWMSKRVADTVRGYATNRTIPHRNIISSACDTLENRIGTTRPFVQTSPNGSEFKTRELCRDVDGYLDGQFRELKIYDLLRLIFRDTFIWGMGFIKVAPSDDGKSIVAERVLPDEMMVDELATIVEPPRFMVQHRYMPRYDAMAEWGDQSPEIASAIRTAPSAFTGVPNSAVQCDMICLLEGWALPGKGLPNGRHCLTIGNCCVSFEPWSSDRFPFAISRWSPQTMGFWSTGCAFAMAPIQDELNVKWEQILTAQHTVAFPGWLAMAGTNVTAKGLAADHGAVHFYTGVKPDPIVPTAMNPEMYNDARDWENFGYSIAGLTQQQAQGEKQEGITSGVAVRLVVNIEDQRNKSRLIMLEDTITDIADLVLRASEQANQSVEVSGRKLSWSEISKKITRDKYNPMAFPVSSLPGTPEGKEQKISEWYADGVVDRRAYFRLQQMPDVVAFSRLTTATDDLVEDTLDNIVRDCKFYAPEPTYDDYARVITQAKARYNLERRLGTPELAMIAIQQFIAKVAELAPSAGPVPTASASPGLVPPSQMTGPGAPIAPSQIQVQPGLK